MKILKFIAYAFLALLILGGSFVAHEWHAKPFFINNFFNREVLKQALKSPEMLSQLHMLENIGIRGHNRELDDASIAAGDEMLADLKAAKETLSQYDDADLSASEKLSKDIANYLFTSVDDYEKYRFHNYPVNQLFGEQNGYPSFMESTHEIKIAEDADHYIDRLKAVSKKFQQVLDGLEEREKRNILPPRFVVDRVLEEMNNFVGTPPKENILYTNLETKTAKIEGFDNAEVLARAEEAIQQNVYPAYQGLIDYFNGLREKTTEDDGYWKLPDGEGAYKAALRLFTTTDLSADEIHNIGLAEVDRIQAEILAILAEQGYDVSAGFSAAIDEMASKEEFYYPDTDAGREQIIADYQTILDEINQGLGDAFSLRPSTTVDVKRIPEFKEKTSPGAYYQPPALDGSRPGQFFANLYDIKATPKYSMRTLAYHEGIPGHHFQVAIAMQLEGMPLFRRFSPFTAYVEGWALYAEQVAWELGFQNDPFDNIGRLQAELFRAVRLVVDTGIHAKRWTRQQAIDYMMANTGMAESDVIAEIERYIVMPGQATSYKIGMMKILELREKAKTALGERFNLSDFHDVVLKNGAVPLDILEQLVDDYIHEKQQ
ncbi:DUF885 domain-containing protein [Pseudoteredinibacter isoporae]|uniref:Uncharacterized protein (DUF885 family) n=1 Tax=Pseudoteredinibacter isoporae TaxID=570281 RepID=A0A7X0JQV2_9GAMM|nr:DUF885 domain-containing protein [Pseudoteredinibacter isoporae]MBB6520580.1 uncharacterized protein (DUF885 family) [Pseudoteredinibacter isoporae]NHO86147.1 DUF885 domain-containing protein [Pseudoteredinibacter isoporae]NIB25402.1 DUF885 domain-containing protein [Pseudoteredinibacter isoporae]